VGPSSARCSLSRMPACATVASVRPYDRETGDCADPRHHARSGRTHKGSRHVRPTQFLEPGQAVKPQHNCLTVDVARGQSSARPVIRHWRSGQAATGRGTERRGRRDEREGMTRFRIDHVGCFARRIESVDDMARPAHTSGAIFSDAAWGTGIHVWSPGPLDDPWRRTGATRGPFGKNLTTATAGRSDALRRQTVSPETKFRGMWLEV
jgi:hypothetical protein